MQHRQESAKDSMSFSLRIVPYGVTGHLCQLRRHHVTAEQLNLLISLDYQAVQPPRRDKAPRSRSTLDRD